MNRIIALITGNPMLLVWIAAGSMAFGVASGGGLAWKVQGWRLDALEGRWQARELVQVTAANKLLTETQDKYRKDERVHVTNQAATVAKLEKGKRDAQVKNDAVLVSLRAGTRWLQFNTPAGASSHRDYLPSIAASASVGDGIATVRLPATVGENLYRLAADADSTADQLRACQAIVVDDRR